MNKFEMSLFYVIPTPLEVILLEVSPEGSKLASRCIFGVVYIPSPSRIVPERPCVVTERLLPLCHPAHPRRLCQRPLTDLAPLLILL